MHRDKALYLSHGRFLYRLLPPTQLYLRCDWICIDPTNSRWISVVADTLARAGSQLHWQGQLKAHPNPPLQLPVSLPGGTNLQAQTMFAIAGTSPQLFLDVMLPLTPREVSQRSYSEGNPDLGFKPSDPVARYSPTMEVGIPRARDPGGDKDPSRRDVRVWLTPTEYSSRI